MAKFKIQKYILDTDNVPSSQSAPPIVANGEIDPIIKAHLPKLINAISTLGEAAGPRPMTHLSHCEASSKNPSDEENKRQALKFKKAKRGAFIFKQPGEIFFVKVAYRYGIRTYFGTSPAKQEDAAMFRASALNLCTVKSLGYFDYKEDGCSYSIQIQSLIPKTALALNDWVTQTLEKPMTKKNASSLSSDDWINYSLALGKMLAAMHKKHFFHADLKPYHAFLSHNDSPLESIEERLIKVTWIDLGRCSFWISPRKRIINLYQLFRFFLPTEKHASQTLISKCQIACIDAYCHSTNPRQNDKKRNTLLKKVVHFLDYKKRTHPTPLHQGL